VILFALVGCGSLGLTATSDASVEDARIVLDAIDPAWGLPTEATEVTITGTGMDGATSVLFGRSEVGITRIDDETIVATAPALGFEAVVDVTVVGDAGEDTLTGGFTYAEEAPEDTDPGDTGGGGGGGGSDVNDGKIGGLVQMSLTQYACPTCFDPPAPDVDVTAQGAFHDATRKGWLDWLPAEGSCASNAASDAPAADFLDAGEWMYLTSGSRAIAMRAASDHIFAASGLDESDYVRNAAYDLSVTEGGSGLDAFDVSDAISTPQSFSTVTPADILLTAPRDAFSARILKNNAAFGWSPSGGGGSFVVELQVYNGQTGSALGSVICRGPDDGSLSVPASALSSYPSGSLLVVGMHRYLIGTFNRPDDGSEVDTLATFGVVGTGMLQ